MPCTWLAVLASRIRGLLLGRRLDEDFDREVADHLDLLTDEHIRRGLRRRTRRGARRCCDSEEPCRSRNSSTTHRGLPFVETTLAGPPVRRPRASQEPRLSRWWRFATLAVGIGAGTAVFSVVGAVLLRPLPFKAPGELVRIFETNPLRRWTRNIVAPANYADWRARNTSFTDIAAYEEFNADGSGASDVFLTGFGEPQGLKAPRRQRQPVSACSARRRSSAARSLDDGAVRGPRARGDPQLRPLAIGRSRATPAIVGRTITLSGRVYDVVGVMPRTFFFPGRDVQLWTPFGYTPQLVASSRRPHWLGVIARLQAGGVVRIRRATT